MNIKSILSWIIAIVLGFVIIKVAFWLFNVIFSMIWIILLIGLAVVVAIPLQSYLKNKLFKKW